MPEQPKFCDLCQLLTKHFDGKCQQCAWRFSETLKMPADRISRVVFPGLIDLSSLTGFEYGDEEENQN